MATRRRGRPKLPEDQIRTVSITILVTREERRWIDRAAKAADMSISSWARERILAGFGRGDTGTRPRGR